MNKNERISVVRKHYPDVVYTGVVLSLDDQTFTIWLDDGDFETFRYFEVKVVS